MFSRLMIAVATTVLMIVTSCIFPAVSLSKSAIAQVPGVYPFKLGDFTITVLSDGTLPQDLHTLLSNTNPTETDRLLQKNFLTNPVETSINAFLIDTGDRQVLVDTGAGTFFGPKLGGKLQTSLKATGYTPNEIDAILLTHIHTDHSGGLVEAGQRVFPAATLYVGKPDVDFWLDRANATRFNVAEKYFDEAAKTVKPYLDAGKVKSFSGKTALLPGITAHLTPGHTPTLLVIAAMWRQARARASSFGAILFTLLRCNFPSQKLQLLMMSMPMLLRHNAKNSLRERKHPEF